MRSNQLLRHDSAAMGWNKTAFTNSCVCTSPAPGLPVGACDIGCAAQLRAARPIGLPTAGQPAQLQRSVPLKAGTPFSQVQHTGVGGVCFERIVLLLRQPFLSRIPIPASHHVIGWHAQRCVIGRAAERQVAQPPGLVEGCGTVEGAGDESPCEW